MIAGFRSPVPIPSEPRARVGAGSATPAGDGGAPRASSQPSSAGPLFAPISIALASPALFLALTAVSSLLTAVVVWAGCAVVGALAVAWEWLS